MARNSITSTEADLAFATMARTLADEDARKGVKRVRCREYEAILKKLAKRLGMSVYEMYIYLGIRNLAVSRSSPDGW
jgi:hypothetical protein